MATASTTPMTVAEFAKANKLEPKKVRRILRDHEFKRKEGEQWALTPAQQKKIKEIVKAA